MRFVLAFISILSITSFGAVNDTLDYWNFHIDDSLVLNYSRHKKPIDITIEISLQDLDTSKIIRAERILCSLPCIGCASIMTIKDGNGKEVFQSEQNSFVLNIPLNLFSENKATPYAIHFSGGQDWDHLRKEHIILFIELKE